jgi:adenylate cyclase
MNLEIERKFLVTDDAWRRDAIARAELRQGYLANTAASSVRVRVAGAEGWLSVKAMRAGRTREEFEYAIPLADALALLDGFSEGPTVEKIRHRVPVGGHEFEVDEFQGANYGLVVAEVELDHADQEFPRPPWLGDEVTDDARYYNFRLAGEPFRDWPAALRAAVARGGRQP